MGASIGVPEGLENTPFNRLKFSPYQSCACTPVLRERLSRWSRLRVHTYFVGELEKNFVEMGDAEVPFVVGQLRHHQLGKRGLSRVGKHVDVKRMMLLLL